MYLIISSNGKLILLTSKNSYWDHAHSGGY